MKKKEVSYDMASRRNHRVDYHSVYRSKKHKKGFLGWLQDYGRLVFFPFLFIYLETVLHLHMALEGRTFLIWWLFGIAAGGLCTVLTAPFSRKVNTIISRVLAFGVSLVYIIEMFCKKILQSYYAFSILKVAAENRMDSYLAVVVSTVLKNIPMILVFFLPAILLLIFGEEYMRFGRLKLPFAGLLAIATLGVHLIALLFVYLPWKGDVTPKMLYKTDVNIEDKVEQLGLWTMLRLDLKYTFNPPEEIPDDDFDDPTTSVTETGTSETETGLPETETGIESEIESESEPETVPVDTSPNIMDIDDKLESLKDSKSDTVSWLSKYFLSKSPTNKNAYTGMFKDYNIVFFTLEGVSGYAIDPELTPTLYKMQTEGFNFTNFYTALHYTSTSGGECQNMLGLYPKDGGTPTMKATGQEKTNVYFSLARQLGRLGYTNLGYHGNTEMYGRYESHTNMGYNWKQYDGEKGLKLEMKDNGKDYLWPQKDKYVVETTVDDYIHSDDPLNIYYLTISGHMPYSNNRIAQQYRDIVDPLPYTEKTKCYIATVIEVDRAVESLIKALDEAGKLENTLIAMVPDHVPYFDVDTLEELAGAKFGSSEDLEMLKEGNINIDVYRSCFLLWSASMEKPITVDKVGCQVDVLPTISNLMGLEYDSRLLSGRDLLSDSEGLVVFHSRSWKSDVGYYNRYSQEFTLNEGVNMTDEEKETYVAAMKKYVSNLLECTDMIVSSDYYDKVFGS